MYDAQGIIDGLNADIEKLTKLRDDFQEYQNGRNAVLKPKKTPAKAKSNGTASARSIAQRKRWAEQKRKQREEAAKAKAAKK